MRTLIHNGKIVLHTGIIPGDLLIEDEEVAAIGLCLQGLGKIDHIIDATDKLIFPGLIDAHVHMPWKIGEFRSTDDFDSGTHAAVYGGVTTIIDFAIPEKGESLSEAVQKRRKEAEGFCYTDFGFHVAINHFRESLVEEIQETVKAGVPSFKIYMLYPGLQLRDGEIYQIMQWVKKAGGLIGVHAESNDIINFLITRFVSQNRLDPYYHYLSRPDFAEAEAIQRLIFLNQVVNGKLYFVHVSSSISLELINKAKNQGQKVYAETCPQYLLLTSEKYKEPEGYLFLTSPSFKTTSDCKALWKGIENGKVDFVSTDHCPFSFSQKGKYKDNFTKIPNGLPGVETRLPLLITEGFWHRHIPLERIVQIMSYNPARILGLYPQKGTLQVGSDADLVIFDPDTEFVIQNNKLHMNVDWSPYEGFQCRGLPYLVMRRGEILYRQGKWIADKPRGKFIVRRIS
jgi:dihydropyrimidinase